MVQLVTLNPSQPEGLKKKTLSLEHPNHKKKQNKKKHFQVMIHKGFIGLGPKETLIMSASCFLFSFPFCSFSFLLPALGLTVLTPCFRRACAHPS